ncbi:RsmB/NOP family class I SAM-dependent RNA methyltransferase [Pelagicoccus sp. SDUM812003]|uniref:RsmB/NOP family class I SAM-dependent RNA methyltransferase n=1 Tax=Pelagicoccus sp. SDUM812003 TaxID=3041267 RepID=UPI00280C9DBF|nr:RsmB/NOP family class I SAM-dependent RNA methyltransferase [Pelagicoccus sp. SDUM812003]MDQ8205137.1 RsmB/NOP family class I SAM-dependent RNA methyltransferase [Pelagicoccus sp. SDUM812003]
MREVALNKEARMHRLQNQRRITYSLIERARTLLAPGKPFSRELHELFRSQGKFGSKDRRLYRELIYTYLRYLPWLDPIYKDQSAFMNALICLAAPTEEVSSLYPTLPDKRPPELPEGKRHKVLKREDHQLMELLPDWFANHCKRHVSIRSLLPLISRPPLWLRIQRDPEETVLDQLRKAPPNAEIAQQIAPHPEVPNCLHAPADFKLTELPVYLNGMVEIQDISSQILLNLIPSPVRGNWLDACAGAGGKTLQLAKLLKPYGKVDAYEPRASAVRELSARVKRSELSNITLLDRRPSSGQYDGVLVDAPCSGSGTWRRHPYLMRQTRERDVFDYAEKQFTILKSYAPLVKTGGLLVYCTCSLSRFENEAVTERFLKASSEYEHQPLPSQFGLQDHGLGITVYPEDFNGDGLYVACLKRVR